MSSGGALLPPGVNGSGRFTIGSCRPLGPTPRLTTFQVRFLSQDEDPAPLSTCEGPPLAARALRSSSSGGTACGCARGCTGGGSTSSGQDSKNFGPPWAVASQVTQPVRQPGCCARLDGPLARPSPNTMGILMMPSSRTCCGPLCSTHVPQRSTATSSLSRETPLRTTMSPLLEPLEKTIFQRGKPTFSRYLGPPTAVASTVAQPRGYTGIRCRPVA
mmetsp:Transcript_108634/g.324874  ORF Transcript_108634/g.324874 Transcript_108634/m.324874 type:complete len:217 (+) Transcript_108634:336-986(+)